MLMWAFKGKWWWTDTEERWWLARLRDNVLERYEGGEWIARAKVEFPEEDEEWVEEVIKKGRAFRVERLPSKETIEQWRGADVVEAIDGCTVKPDGVCPHGAPSWLIVLGVI